MKRQQAALQRIERMQAEWDDFCLYVLADRDNPVRYTAEARVLKRIGDAFIYQMQSWAEEL